MPDEIIELLRECREAIDTIEFVNNNQEEFHPNTNPVSEMLKFSEILKIKAESLSKALAEMQ